MRVLRMPGTDASLSVLLSRHIAKAAMHLGFRIPDDLSLVGCGNQEIARILSPELTTTPSYPERSAEIAVEKLLGQLNDPQHRRSRTVLQITELVIGGSTRIWRPPEVSGGYFSNSQKFATMQWEKGKA